MVGFEAVVEVEVGVEVVVVVGFDDGVEVVVGVVVGFEDGVDVEVGV